MSTNGIPEIVENALGEPIYERTSPELVARTLSDLGTTHQLLKSFFERFEGSFWSEHLGYEMLDLLEGEENVRLATEQCRQQFGFPDNFLILTQWSAGQVVVLDVVKDEVFEVDFEGGERLLLEGSLQPRWNDFRSFLKEYFSGLAS